MRTNIDLLPDWERVLSSAARLQRPVQILGSLDGIETGVRQLMRDEPLETTVVNCVGAQITVPTESEMLRIKAVLILRRNATRDYIDFVALADHLGDIKLTQALASFDQLYRQDSGESPLQQLQVQLANALPYDLEETELAEYKHLDARWHHWSTIQTTCSHLATVIFDRVCQMQASPSDDQA